MGKMNRHILTNNEITDDKSSLQLFSQTGGNSVIFTQLNNNTHRSVEIKTFKNSTAPNIKQMKLRRKYSLGMVSDNN